MKPGGQVQQPYSYSISAPIDCLKIPALIPESSDTGEDTGTADEAILNKVF
jgi:hypothetical protein